MPKKDSGTRVTTNLRVLNTVIETDVYQMEGMHDTQEWISKIKIFSTINLKAIFLHKILAVKSKPLTALQAIVGLLQCKILPQDLNDTPGTFW